MLANLFHIISYLAHQPFVVFLFVSALAAVGIAAYYEAFGKDLP